MRILIDLSTGDAPARRGPDRATQLLGDRAIVSERRREMLVPPLVAARGCRHAKMRLAIVTRCPA
jgi:hypothetical protein